MRPAPAHRGAIPLALSAVSVSVAAFVSGTAAMADPVPAGPEIEIMIGGGDPSVCTGGAGTYVVAANGSTTPELQRFDAEGNALGTVAPIPTFASASAGDPDLACNAGGEFIVVWQAFDVVSTGAWDVFARRYDATGTPVGPEFQVNSGPSTDPIPPEPHPAVSLASDGSFVVAWITGVTDGVVARRFDANAVALGPEFSVDTGPHGQPDVAHDAAGAFTIVSGETARRYDATGTPAGGPITLAASNFTTTRVCYDGVGNSIIVGETFAQRYDPSGTPLGSALWFASPRQNLDVAVTCSADGEFVVAWTQGGWAQVDGDQSSVRARRFDPADAAIGPELRPNSTRVGFQGGSLGTGSGPQVAIAGDDGGRVLLVWTDRRVPQDNLVRTTARFYCDDADPSCRFACPGHDPGVDPDGDGVPSGCDPCTNIGGARDLVGRTSLFVSNRKPGGSTKRTKMNLKGAFDLPAGIDFASLAPDLDGARAQIDSGAVGTILDAVLPGGTLAGAGTRGWRLNGPGTKWRYKDKTAARASGIFRVTITDDSSSAPGRVRVAIKGRSQEVFEAIYPLVDEDTPPHAVVVVGGQTMSDAGACGELAFTATDCAFKDGTPIRPIRLRCKRK